jgi:hypothetical protein
MRVSFVLEMLLTNQIELCVLARRIWFGFTAKPSESASLARHIPAASERIFAEGEITGLNTLFVLLDTPPLLCYTKLGKAVEI